MSSAEPSHLGLVKLISRYNEVAYLPGGSRINPLLSSHRLLAEFHLDVGVNAPFLVDCLSVVKPQVLETAHKPWSPFSIFKG